MDDFGAIIKEYRILRKMSQEELAEKIGSKKQVISRYERGERIPKISAGKKIADALGISLSTLMGVEEPEEEIIPPSPRQKLMDFVSGIPEEKCEQVLRIMKAILAEGGAE